MLKSVVASDLHNVTQIVWQLYEIVVVSFFADTCAELERKNTTLQKELTDTQADNKVINHLTMHAVWSCNFFAPTIPMMS